MRNRLFVRPLQFGHFVLLMLLVGLIGTASAAEVKGLYSAQVPVDGQGAEARNAAIRVALGEVLVKVTGNRDIPLQPQLQGDLAQASRYVQQYRYLLDERPAAAGEVAVEPARLLQVSFDAGAVQGLLRERRLPVWGSNRPASLVWFGVEQAGRRRLMLPELDEELMQAFRRAADRRGIPLLFPLMDLQDQGSVGVADLWGGFDQNIQRASERYRPDVILTGRLHQLSGQRWRASWRLNQGGQMSQWEADAASPGQLAELAIERAADLLAERFAPVGAVANLSRVRLRVDGIDSIAAYDRVRQFLRSQSVVANSRVVLVEPQAVTYDLDVRGGIQGLQQGLSLGRQMEPTSELPEGGRVAEGIDLFYRVR